MEFIAIGMCVRFERNSSGRLYDQIVMSFWWMQHEKSVPEIDSFQAVQLQIVAEQKRT